MWIVRQNLESWACGSRMALGLTPKPWSCLAVFQLHCVAPCLPFSSRLRCRGFPLPSRRTSRPRNQKLERALRVAQKQAALSKSILFLSRTQQVFQLWHVVHRPFSYEFAILAILHIGIALFMGYRL
jgi:hypothetical protein